MSNTKAVDVLVCGAGGFIGGWLVADLRKAGIGRIRAVDLKPLSQWNQRFDDVENLSLDLRDGEACRRALEGGAASVYNLAVRHGWHGLHRK